MNTEMLKEIIKSRGTSQRKIAKQLGITEKTFYTKMKTGEFVRSEIEMLIQILGIENPAKVFFSKVKKEMG